MILEIYIDSFQYSIKKKTALLKLGLITLFSFLILPIILLFGYSCRIIEIGLNGVLLENEDPSASFVSLGQMFIDGFKVIAVLIIYSLPAIIVSIFSIFRFDLIKITNMFTYFKIDFQIDFGLGFIVLFFIVWFITFLFVSTAIPHMVNKKSFKDAFKLRELVTIIKHVGIFEYLKFYISFIFLAFCFLVLGILATQIILNVINIISFNFYHFTFKGFSGIIANIAIFAIISSFILIPIFLIVESRVASFVYNEDALIEKEYS